MPSSSDKQRRFRGMELAAKRAGKKTKTGMTEKQLREFASGVEKVHASRKRRRAKKRR
jgi:hypothetical protein